MDIATKIQAIREALETQEVKPSQIDIPYSKATRYIIKGKPVKGDVVDRLYNRLIEVRKEKVHDTGILPNPSKHATSEKVATQQPPTSQVHEFEERLQDSQKEQNRLQKEISHLKEELVNLKNQVDRKSVV